MQLILIKNNNLRKLTLPKIIQGNFWITDLDENGIEKNIINVEARDGKWHLVSNLEVYYVEKDKKVPSIELSNYNFYTLKAKTNYIYIYCCPLLDNTYKYYEINNSEITIGKDKNSTIHYMLNFLQDMEAKIISKGNYLQIVPNNNSTLGIFVDDTRIHYPTTLENGDYIFIGGLKIVYVVLKDKKALIINNIPAKITMHLKEIPKIELPNPFTKEEEDIEGNLYNDDNYFHKKPRFIQVLEEYNIEIDAPPSNNSENKQPFILMIGPMLTTSMMSIMYGYNAVEQIRNNNGNISSGIMSIVMCITMLAGTLVWPTISRNYDQKRAKKSEKLRQEKYGEYLEKIKEKINKEVINQQNILLSNNPNIQESQNTILNKTVDLWQRRVEDDDFLTVTLGYGNIPMKINVKYPEEHFSLEEDILKNMALNLGKEQKVLTNVPLTFSLRENNILALIGKLGITTEYLKNILLQLIAYHSYDNLKIVILTNEDNQFFWKSLRSLPHLYNDNKDFRYYGTNTEEYKEILYQLDGIINQRKNNENNKDDKEKLWNPHYLIITDCFKSIRNFELINQMFENKSLGFSMLILNDKISTLPDQCQNFVNIDGEQGELFKTILNAESKIFKIDNVPIQLEACVKTLANIPIEITSTSDGQMPNKVGFLEMYNVGKIEQLNIENRWKTSNPMLTLGAPVGIGKSGEKVTIDLHEKYHGPHGLVAGMTGSGKSEFLISYILSMAVNYHPYEVQFILIDYKGGGLAGAFENQLIQMRLPHLVGTITNLDKNEIKRSLASIESELKRRQRKFNEAREIAGESTIDIYKYQKLYRQGIIKEPISHLFIISDEFAELKAQEPEFMDQLISTARIGRSLGVHLILATQKPSGVVNDQIWSNTRFRVCLRVQDTSDSNEVIKCPDAAFLKQVGRFYFQVGQNEIFTIGQSAYGGVPYIPSETIKKSTDSSINILNNIGVSIANLEENKKTEKVEDKGEELLNIVNYLSQIGKDENIQVTPLWLPKMPELIYIENIKRQFNYKPTPFVFNPVIGLYDDPNSQYQGLATINLTENGSTLIYGMSSSGEVLLLGTLIYSLSIEHTPQEVNIYAIDCGSETLTMYKNLPQVGDVALIIEQEKIINLFKMISEIIAERKKLFVEYNGEYNYYIKHSSNPLPAIVLIISNYESFRETYEDIDDLIRVISRDCVKYGVYLIFTSSSTNGVRGNVSQNFGNTLSLQLNDESDYSYLFGSINKLTPSSLYGRGLIKLDQVYEYQTAHVTDDDNLIPYIKELSEKLSIAYQGYKAKKVPILPEIVKFEELITKDSSLEKLPIGVNKETLDTVTYNFRQDKGTLILMEDEENIPKVFKNFSKAFNKFSKLIVVDAGNIIEPTKEYIYINNNLEQNLNNLINLQNDGNQYLCVFLNMNNFIKKLKDESKKQLSKLFEKAKNENSNIHFILFGIPDSLKEYTYEDWYQGNIENKSGIFIGNGIDNQNILNVEDSFKLSKIKVANNYAFIIKKGKAVLVKIIEE